MSIANMRLGDYFNKKSVKLSDSYRLFITEKVNDKYVSTEYVNCISFSIPTISYNVEEHIYGNRTQRVLIPNYEGVGELTIELLEDNNANVYRKLINKWIITSPSMSRISISSIKIEILSNNFEKVVGEWNFSNLKLTKYDRYENSYGDDSPCKWNLSFAFEKGEYTAKNKPI